MKDFWNVQTKEEQNISREIIESSALDTAKKHIMKEEIEQKLKDFFQDSNQK
jgi:hypothetical protein